MNDIHEKLARVKEAFADDPDALDKIEDEGRRVQKLLDDLEYFQLPATQAILSLCHKDILTARKKLAMERSLSESAREQLWLIIDAREWFLNLVSHDFETELAEIEGRLDADLSV